MACKNSENEVKSSQLASEGRLLKYKPLVGFASQFGCFEKGLQHSHVSRRSTSFDSKSQMG